MPITHLTRNRETYYLHSGVSKTGKTRYWFAQASDGDLVDAIPEGYEVYENPESQVFLRKIVPQLITQIEVAAVQKGLERYAPGQNCLVDVEKQYIVIYHADHTKLDPHDLPSSLHPLSTFFHGYIKVMRFTLVDEIDRTFHAERWCFRGSIDNWIDLHTSGSVGKLTDLVKKFSPHFGQESFFELF